MDNVCSFNGSLFSKYPNGGAQDNLLPVK